ncbi:hypothetical protein FH972_009181 [Carpinus fangiana]|uniref:F-box domain-containing protein n=1 Tax=Carpinus fangiana TaxID=176857 RepID=A0A5N6R3A9_9ROSI|nr:hypothetical protein FH972_009181 [Carpinus fangiana]
MAKERMVKDEEEEEAQIHGDILETILSHVPLIDLAPSCHVSKTWERAVTSSLRHLNPTKPWLVVHTQKTRSPYATTMHAYDPRSSVWVEIQEPSINYVSALRSSHSTLLYMLSPFKISFSVDPLNLTWHRADARLVWRPDPIVALVGHRIVVAGGTCEFGEDPLAMETYDLRTRMWDTCGSMPEILKDSAASTWLSVAVDEHRMYLMEKSNGVTHAFNPSTKAWQGPFDLRPGKQVFSSLIGFVSNRMVLVGLIGDAENVKGVKLWEVEGDMSELKLKEMGEMPTELVEKLKGESPCVTSIAMTSMGDYAYLHNPSDPGELILCEVEDGVCKWGSVRNVVVNDATRMRNLVFTCSNVGLGDVEDSLRSGHRRHGVIDS